MKIKLTALSLALASVSVMSFADVSLYGKVAVGIENDQFQNSTIPSTGSVQDFGSYFGIRGTDQVYGENAAIWQVEQALDVASGQAYSNKTATNMIVPNGGANHVNGQVNTLASSETYLGLQGVWGRVRLGNLSNYMRSNMGNVDIYNYASGADGLGAYSRSIRLIPTAIRYDSPVWGGFSFAAAYGFNSSGLPGVSGISGNNNFAGGLAGNYSGGIYSLGINWTDGLWNVALGTMIWQNVGTYTTGNQGTTTCTGTQEACYPNSSYSGAYANKLEVGYNDPDGLIFGAGFQTTSGLAWNSWANSGGSLGLTYNPAAVSLGVASQLLANQLQTQEAAASLGYHLGPWTPKIGFSYGNNLMTGGMISDVAFGTANQIADSGYKQLVAELDWNITPRTLAFLNFGQIWWGNTLSNIAFNAASNGAAVSGVVDGNNSYQNNQSTVALGFTHTF
ncbi:MAG: porin [Proteobacteria bacterium]|jgi:predicted porin|nr:porin [Pseudomonadota bacterium]